MARIMNFSLILSIFFCGTIFATDLDPAKSVQFISENERELYLVPGGKYSEGDILANAGLTPSQKFIGFIPKHNANPKKGEKMCPITFTKANPQCTWTVDGKTHQFCCPPCIDEFVLLAKEHPDQIKDPEFYIMK